MIDTFVAAQIVGSVALCISVVVFQIDNRRRMLRLSVVAAIVWTIHFALLGAGTGAAMNAIGGGRDYTLSRSKPTRKNVYILLLIASAAIGATIVTWDGFRSVLPCAACILNALCFWTTNTRTIRRLYLVVPPLWISYNVITHSYPGMITDSLVLVSNLIAQARFDFKLKKQIVALKKPLRAT